MSIRNWPLAFVLVSMIVKLSTVSAQTPMVSTQAGDHNQPYSLASVNGEFALVGSYTGGIARQLGIVHIKDGDLTGFIRVNVQGSTPTQRVVVYISFTGAMTVAEDGTGVVTLTVTYPDQSVHEATLDILITKAQESKWGKTAMEIEGMQRETPALSPGSLIVNTLIRRPQ
ncbi:MAG: hypothetical protein JO182_15570 [Acidobacteriaceae bacterium]|nr:hypothetical protein [Acidobacteriaceae bacterium]